MGYQWFSFLWTADEWFINYTLPPALAQVKLFIIGHSIELYLKAAYTYISDDVNKAISFGHRIKSLLDACKELVPSFMPSYEIRDKVLETIFDPNQNLDHLEKDNLEHYFAHQELYFIAKMLPDLKYLGAPLKTIKGPYGLVQMERNPYWIDFLTEIREFIDYPRADLQDIIKYHLEEDDLPHESQAYLRLLYPMQ